MQLKVGEAFQSVLMTMCGVRQVGRGFPPPGGGGEKRSYDVKRGDDINKARGERGLSRLEVNMLRILGPKSPDLGKSGDAMEVPSEDNPINQSNFLISFLRG
jgi:hypothetical protein